MFEKRPSGTQDIAEVFGDLAWPRQRLKEEMQLSQERERFFGGCLGDLWRSVFGGLSFSCYVSRVFNY